MRTVFPLILIAGLVCSSSRAQTPDKPGETVPGQTAAPARGQAGTPTQKPTLAPAQPQTQKPVPAPQPKPEDLPPGTPVITLNGFCEKPPAAAGECKTVVTKEQFERLANALNPNMPPQVRRQLAQAYAQALVFSAAADQRGLANTAEAQQLFQFARMQALSQLLLLRLQDEASRITPQEVEKYYNEHAPQFQEATVRRIFIPKAKPSEKPGEPVRLNEATVKAEAEKMRARAAAGEDPDKLQKEAYANLGIKTDPPPSQPTTVTREQLPPTHAQVFDLKPGEVSQPFEEPGGFYIYKLEAKRTIPLESARQQIEQTLKQERLQSTMQEITKGITPQLNDAYFGGGTQAGARTPEPEEGSRPAAKPGTPAKPGAQKPPTQPQKPGAQKPSAQPPQP